MFGLLLAATVVAAQGGAKPPVQQGPADTRAWYQAYADGQRLVNAGNWQAAIPLLELAKRTGPSPGRNVATYGDNFTNFNPDYYLGLAYLNTGRYADADDAFQRVSKVTNLITARDKEYATFQTQSAKAVFEHQMAIANQEFGAKRYDEALQAIGRAKMRATRTDAARVDAMIAQVQGGMRGAASTVATGPAPVQQTPPAYDPKTSQPATVAPDPKTNQPATAAGGGNAKASLPPPITAPSITASNAQSVNRPAPPAMNTPSGYRSTNIAPGYQNVPLAIPVYVGGEQAGMTLFFSGNYAGAATAFEDRIAQNNVSRATYFYLAVSQAALVLAGQADRSLLSAARTYYGMTEAARTAEFVAARRYISPRILRELEGQP